jgi:hypothetical protein
MYEAYGNRAGGRWPGSTDHYHFAAEFFYFAAHGKFIATTNKCTGRLISSN